MEKIKTNTLEQMVAQTLDSMKEKLGASFDINKVNLAEISRQTGISRAKLRRFQKNGWKLEPHGNTGKHRKETVLSGYESQINSYLMARVTNSEVIFENLKKAGYIGSKTSIKSYIARHKDLIPADRTVVSPQGNRGRRYTTSPGESFEMDWGFVNVDVNNGTSYRCACFAMICHHCGERYIEFFTNSKQENLFIGMIHGFVHMGIPQYILTDNMKSVVIGRDSNGFPLWQKDYEVFMKTLGFQTKLCKPRHPFTKGAVERLVRFVKENFMTGRVFGNLTDLNIEAFKWCIAQDNHYHRGVDCVPSTEHESNCRKVTKELIVTKDIRKYLAPKRTISFDGFIEYEGRRFGVPASYTQKVCRVMRDGFYLHILDMEAEGIITTHNVTWGKRDTYCEGQFLSNQPEEYPTAPVRIRMRQNVLDEHTDREFDKFDFTLRVKKHE